MCSIVHNLWKLVLKLVNLQKSDTIFEIELYVINFIDQKTFSDTALTNNKLSLEYLAYGEAVEITIECNQDQTEYYLGLDSGEYIGINGL